LDLIENLSRLQHLDQHPELIQAMQMAGNLVVTRAKADHPRPASKSERKAHPYKRFYTWTGKLVNSMRIGETQAFFDRIIQFIHAGDGLTDYAAAVEFGTVNAKAYPFFLPALNDTKKDALKVMGLGVLRAIRGSVR
jgi:HK97 gp10 family phage protein